MLTFTKQYDDANLMPTRELEKQAKHSGVHTHTCASCLRRVTACGNTASRRRRGEEKQNQRADSENTYSHKHINTHITLQTHAQAVSGRRASKLSLIKVARSAIR